MTSPKKSNLSNNSNQQPLNT